MQIANLEAVDSFTTLDGSTRATEEIYFFTRGAGRMPLEEEEQDVQQGDCVVIPPAPATSSGTTARSSRSEG